LYLEDDSGRILITGSVVRQLVHSLVTGIIIAVRGKCTTQGEFELSDVAFAIDMDPQPSSVDGLVNVEDLRLPPQVADPLLLLVSGFEIGSPIEDEGYLLACEMLTYFINGRLGGPEDVHLASRIARQVLIPNYLTSCVYLRINVTASLLLATPLHQWNMQ
jgi:hypothetical protein